MPEIRIDAHQHFWQPDRGDYGWLDGAPDILRRAYLPGDLKPTLDRFGITHTILVQAAPTVEETEYLLRLAGENDFIAGVVGWLDMEAAGFPDELAGLRENPKFLGIRPMLQDLQDDRFILRPVVLDGLARLADAKLTFDVLSFPRHLPYVAEALDRTPGLRAVVDHLSKPPVASGAMEPWRSGIAALAAMPNVYCKLSGLITEADSQNWSVADLAPYVEHAVACFGPHRLMWGSDWPVCRLAGEYGEVLAATILALPPELRGDPRIFGGNAAQFYGLAKND